MCVANFKILGTVVPEKSLTKKKVYTQTNTHTEKAKTIYPLYTTGGIKCRFSHDTAHKWVASFLFEKICMKYLEKCLNARQSQMISDIETKCIIPTADAQDRA